MTRANVQVSHPHPVLPPSKGEGIILCATAEMIRAAPTFHYSIIHFHSFSFGHSRISLP